MRVCWNRQTGTFEGRVWRRVRVQVPSLAPKRHQLRLMSFFISKKTFRDLNPKRADGVKQNSPGDCFVAARCAGGYRMRKHWVAKQCRLPEASCVPSLAPRGYRLWYPLFCYCLPGSSARKCRTNNHPLCGCASNVIQKFPQSWYN